MGPLYLTGRLLGNLRSSIDEFHRAARKGGEMGSISPLFKTRIMHAQLLRIKKQLDRLGMRVAVACLDEMISDMRREFATVDDLDRFLSELDNTIRRELRGVLFFHVPHEQAQRYKDGQMLFGADVIHRFPKTAYDIEQAARCYAFGCSTACVFHLMRVMEVGVQRFGQIAGVDFPEDKEWGKILKIASGKIEKEKEARPRHGRDPEIIAWCEIYSHLSAVGTGCRNQFMHPKATCTMEEARDLISVVGAFMRALAKRTSQTIPGPAAVQ